MCVITSRTIPPLEFEKKKKKNAPPPFESGIRAPEGRAPSRARVSWTENLSKLGL